MSKLKTFLTVALIAVFLAPSGLSLHPVSAAEGPVCGIDNQTYESAEAAEAAGVEVSYDFACVEVTDESKLYEKKVDVNFAGMLIEVGSTDIPTNLIIRRNGTQDDYTVTVTEDTLLGQRRDQFTKLSDWIPGDQIRVIGKKNENTGNVDAAILVNLSIHTRRNVGANGWITKIDKENKTITYQWMNKEHTFRYDENTRFVAGLKNPASVDDLRVNDRIRARLIKRAGEEPLAKIVVVLRRGKDLFMKIRTFIPNVTLVRINSTVIPTTIQVKMDKTPGLRANDVNNLIGTEGRLITVNITEDTKLVRKYFGRTTLDQFSVGDSLKIIGRVNDDGTVDAKVVKNNSIWMTSTQGHAGVVKEVNTEKGYFKMEWTPVRHVIRKKLKEKLRQKKQGGESSVKAQIVGLEKIKSEIQATQVNQLKKQAKNTKKRVADELKNLQQTKLRLEKLQRQLQLRIKKLKKKIKRLREKVGKFERQIKFKRVKIDRIKTKGLKLREVVKRLPPKIVRVDITDKTRIAVGTNTNASLSDIKVGDKVRVRGVRHKKLPIVTAHTVVVVSSLPEIEEPLDVDLDEINEAVDEIVTDKTDEAIVPEVVSDTEEEIEAEESDSTEVSSKEPEDTEESIVEEENNDEEGNVVETEEEMSESEEGIEADEGNNGGATATTEAEESADVDGNSTDNSTTSGV